MRIRAYRNTCTRAYSIWEQGSGVSLYPWGRNSAYYEGYSSPVVLEVPEIVETSMAGMCMIFSQGGCYDAGEAIACGHAKLVVDADPSAYPDVHDLMPDAKHGM